LAKAVDEAHRGARVALLVTGDLSDDPNLRTALKSANLSFETVPGIAGAQDIVLPASQAA